MFDDLYDNTTYTNTLLMQSSESFAYLVLNYLFQTYNKESIPKEIKNYLSDFPEDLIISLNKQINSINDLINLLLDYLEKADLNQLIELKKIFIEAYNGIKENPNNIKIKDFLTNSIKKLNLYISSKGEEIKYNSDYVKNATNLALISSGQENDEKVEGIMYIPPRTLNIDIDKWEKRYNRIINCFSLFGDEVEIKEFLNGINNRGKKNIFLDTKNFIKFFKFIKFYTYLYKSLKENDEKSLELAKKIKDNLIIIKGDGIDSFLKLQEKLLRKAKNIIKKSSLN